MRLLITRPQPDADELAAELERRGHRCLVAPLMTIVPTVSDLPLGGVQALLLTSRNGVRALAATSARRDVPVLAVGPGTAAAAEDAGFTVEAGAGDVSALGSLVRAALKPGAGSLLWITGRHVRGDLRADLRAAGYDVARHVLYDAQTVSALPPSCVAALQANEIDGALFFSPRTAQTFVRMMALAGLEPAAKSVTAYCLSPAVAAALASLPWRGMEIAGRTDRAALLDLVGRAGVTVGSGA
jgi:uroporphyrinogen-III synthase